MNKLNLVFSALLALPGVSAQGLPVPDVLDNTIRSIFTGSVDLAYQRLIIFIGVFTIFYAVMHMLPFARGGSGYDSVSAPKGITITLSLVLSGIATFTMPENLVETIFNLYSGLFGVVLLFGPVLWLLYITFKYIPGDTRGGHFARFFFLAIIGLILMAEELILRIPLLEQIGAMSYLQLVGIIILFIAFYNLAQTFTSGSSDSISSSSTPSNTNYKDLFKPNNSSNSPEVDDEKMSMDEEMNTEKDFEDLEETEKKIEQTEEKQGEELEKETKNSIEALKKMTEGGSVTDALKTLEKELNKIKTAFRNIPDPSEQTLIYQKEYRALLKLTDLLDRRIKIKNFITKELENQANKNPEKNKADKIAQDLQKQRDLLNKYQKSRKLVEGLTFKITQRFNNNQKVYAEYDLIRQNIVAAFNNQNKLIAEVRNSKINVEQQRISLQNFSTTQQKIFEQLYKEISLFNQSIQDMKLAKTTLDKLINEFRNDSAKHIRAEHTIMRNRTK